MDPEHKKYILENANSPSLNKTVISVSMFLIIILGFAVYANSLHGKFIFDDGILIKNNAFIKNWVFLPKFFTKDIVRATSLISPFYRPLQMVTYALDYHIWQLNVVGYHLTNIILHILVALSIYWLINIIFHDNVISILAALFFVVHPIHATVVSYISTRAEELYLLFMLISFIFYIKSIHKKNMTFFLIMISSYSLSLLSKENALIFPVLLLLFHYTFKKKVRMREFLLVSGVAVIYIVLRVTALRHLLSYAVVKGTFVQRIPGFFAAIANYARLIFLPFGLHMEYGNRLFNFTDPRAIAGLAIVGTLIFCIIKTVKTNRIIFFPLSWFVVTLLPVSNLYPLNAYMSENWLYLPSVGLFLALAGLLSPFFKKEKTRIAAVIFTSCLLVFYSVLTVKQNRTWAEPIPFYERTLKYAPDSSRVYNNLAVAYYEIGRNEDAILIYKKAIELNPNGAEAYTNLGIAYYKAGKKEDAILMYKKAIESNPDYANAYNNLASTYYAMGKIEESVAMYKKTIKLNPYNAEGHNDLGLAYYAMGKIEESVAMLKKAIELNPNYADPYNNLGNAYNSMGKKEDAVAMYKKAIELNPNYANAYYNLGATYFSMGRREDAVAAFKKAVEINPDHADARRNLEAIETRPK